MGQDPTCFVPHPLAPGSKVKGLPHSQLWLMQVILVNIGSGVRRSELIKALAIEGDVAGHLQTYCQQVSAWADAAHSG